MIEMVDELKTDKLESFVGNDPRSMYNLVLHMLDTDIPHRIEDYDPADIETANAVAEVSKFLNTAWQDVSDTFRRSNPRQSLSRTNIGFLLATGWYSVFAIVGDDGNRCVLDVWNPIETYPAWDGELGLSEVAHIYHMSPRQARMLIGRNNWTCIPTGARWITQSTANVYVYDYWWTEVSDTFPFIMVVWNAVVIDGQLVKFGQTRFKRIPVHVAPVGGLPDMGGLSQGSQLSTAAYSAGSYSVSERWKEEIGQALIATNENIYRTWNKWWSYSLQLIRDTAQPRIFERSRSGKAIVKPEDVFRRGAIFRGGPDDSVEYISTPPIPLELRSTKLDLEAMMQRGGVSWAMFGDVTGQMTSMVMSQIAASADQVMRPFHQAIIDLNSDIDNDWLEDIRERGVKPYSWKLPSNLPDNAKVSAKFEVEIPGDLVHRATVARMLDPDFRLSYTYVMRKLFPNIENPLQEKANIRADMAEAHPTNALVALVQYYRQQSAYLEKSGDTESAKLYDMAAEAALAELSGSMGAGAGAGAQQPQAAASTPRSLMPGGQGNAQMPPIE
jgi:hypothetical protein